MTGHEEIAAALVAVAAVLAALTYIGKWLWSGIKAVRNLVHTVDRVEALVRPTHDVTVHQLNPNSGSSMKDQLGHLVESHAVTRGLVQLVAEEMKSHGDQSRAAMAIYRKALADQGIHLPVAPGEDGYGEHEELTTQ